MAAVGKRGVASAHGFRPGHGPEDVWYDIALHVEESLLLGTPLGGGTLDYSKCFDRIPQGILLKLAEHLGIASAILGPIRGMYSQLRRRFPDYESRKSTRIRPENLSNI